MAEEQDSGSNSIDPKVLYSLDEFIAEEILDDVISEAMVILKTED